MKGYQNAVLLLLTTILTTGLPQHTFGQVNIEELRKDDDESGLSGSLSATNLQTGLSLAFEKPNDERVPI